MQNSRRFWFSDNSRKDIFVNISAGTELRGSQETATLMSTFSAEEV